MKGATRWRTRKKVNRLMDAPKGGRDEMDGKEGQGVRE